MSADPELQRFFDSVNWDFDPVKRLRKTCACGNTYPVYGLRLTCTACKEACDHSTVLHGHIVAINGAKQPHKLCMKCGSLVSLRKGAGEGDYCFKDNRRVHAAVLEPCTRCGSTEGTELHHWAPSAIFGFWESDKWPQSPLCRACHQKWHAKMREAGGYLLPNANVEFGPFPRDAA